MVLVAAAGAVSRYSMTVGWPLGGCTTMNPPPPMFPVAGCVTARAKAVAIAASTALPPCCRIASPAAAPGSETATTTPLRNSGAFSPASTSLVAKLSLATKDAATTTAHQMQEEFRRYLIVHLPVDPAGSVSEGNPFPSLTLFGS